MTTPREDPGPEMRRRLDEAILHGWYDFEEHRIVHASEKDAVWLKVNSHGCPVDWGYIEKGIVCTTTLN